MSQEFNNYLRARDAIVSNTETAQNYRDLMKENIKVRLKNLASQNTNAQMAYDTLFARLIGE
jgi:hypothetical protein